MNQNHYCPRCGKMTLPGNCWCPKCHGLVCKAMHEREHLPVGKGSCFWDGVVQEKQTERDKAPVARRLYRGKCHSCGKTGQIYGHILGTPYCSLCLESTHPSCGVAGPIEDMGPWQENAVRIFEDMLT